MLENSKAEENETEESKEEDLQEEEDSTEESSQQKKDSDKLRQRANSKAEENEIEESKEEDLKEKEDSTEESSQQKEDSAELRQRKMDMGKSSKKETVTTKSSETRVELPESSNIGRSSSETKARKAHVSESLRQIVNWTMTGFFDFNPIYFIQMRGFTNIFHIGLSVSTIVLLSINCQLKPSPESRSEGFYCKPPETFLFVVSCGSLLTSTLYLLCCVLSRKTDYLLFQSTFEVGYFVMYFILLLTASLTLVVSELNWGTNEYVVYESEYESAQIAAIVGLTNSVIYGINAIWFFMSHRLFEIEEQRQIEEGRL